MGVHTPPHPETTGVAPPHMKAMPDSRMPGCPPPERARRVGPLALGLGIGALLWLAIGLFSWQFFR